MLWTKEIDYPQWMDEAALDTLRKGYLSGETPKEAIEGIATKVHDYVYDKKILDNKPEDIYKKVFTYIWNGWICPASPIWSNFRHKKNAPISCFNSHIEDSISGIGFTLSENMRMTQIGGGTSTYWGKVRPRGTSIKSGGKTNGSISFLEIFDTMINKVSQGGTRKGASAAYLPADHGDIEEFLTIKDNDSPIKNIFMGVCIDDNFISKLYEGDSYCLNIWAKILKSRAEKGLPYIFFTDNVNDHVSTPNWYGYNQSNPDYVIKCSNLCTEIMLPSNDEESFVCCLSSLNLAKYDEWKDTDVVQICTILLDAVIEDFIQKAKTDKLLKKTYRFTKNHRAIGIGVLGWHTYLQSKNVPFASIAAKSLNKNIFKLIRACAEEATLALGKAFEPCKIGDGKRRNSTVLAVAPTVSNSTIQGGVSMGIEPIVSNVFVQKSAKGDFIRKNLQLEALLESKGFNTPEIWKSIEHEDGSVQNLSCLTVDEREVFKTFKEINQFAIIDQAADRQEFIDQGQSLNVFIPLAADPKSVSKLYLYAHERGIKSLYYQRGETIMNTNTTVSNTLDDTCLFCQA